MIKLLVFIGLFFFAEIISFPEVADDLTGPELKNDIISSGISNPQAYMLKKVNHLRESGCKCGNQYMESTHSVIWNSLLEKTANMHAKQMDIHDFFSHRSLDGKDIGERLDESGYKWRYAGENLAEGQKNFDEVMADWIESQTHCKMLMNPRMHEMGIGRSGKYWVQHFGTKMPEKTVRKKIYYREG